jgi:hypothetical protein
MHVSQKNFTKFTEAGQPSVGGTDSAVAVFDHPELQAYLHICRGRLTLVHQRGFPGLPGGTLHPH